jgi:hypothetical protein
MRHGYPKVRRMCCGHPGRRGPGRKRSPPGFDNPHEAYASSDHPERSSTRIWRLQRDSRTTWAFRVS